MSGNGRSPSNSLSADPIHELDEIIRLVHFLSRCKPGGFSITLAWIEERLRAIRDTIGEPGHQGDQSIPPIIEQSRSFPLLKNIAALCADREQAGVR